MRHLDGVYTQRFNRRERTDGPLFRGRYRSVLIDEDSHLASVSRYIHLNPVEAGIVAQPEDHRESSYRAYVGLGRRPAWLNVTETLSRFEPGDARKNYRRFVMGGIDEDTRTFYAEGRRPPVLGSEEFRRRIEQQVRATESRVDPERPDRQLLIDRPTLDEIAAAVYRAFGVLGLASTRGHQSSVVKGAIVLLGREVGGRPLAEVASWIGYRSYAAAAKATTRLRDRMRRVPEIRHRIESARSRLGMRGRSEEKSQAKT
jgi:hypothetical protein